MKAHDKSLTVFTISSTLIFIITMTANIGILWFTYKTQHKTLLGIFSGVKLEAGMTVLRRNFLFLGGASSFFLLILSLLTGRIFSQRYRTSCLLEDSEQKLTLTNLELDKSLKNVKVLEGLLPACAACKKVRDDKGCWNPIDHYLAEYNDAQITHSICPECSKRVYID